MWLHQVKSVILALFILFGAGIMGKQRAVDNIINSPSCHSKSFMTLEPIDMDRRQKEIFLKISSIMFDRRTKVMSLTILHNVRHYPAPVNAALQSSFNTCTEQLQDQLFSHRLIMKLTRAFSFPAGTEEVKRPILLSRVDWRPLTNAVLMGLCVSIWQWCVMNDLALTHRLSQHPREIRGLVLLFSWTLFLISFYILPFSSARPLSLLPRPAVKNLTQVWVWKQGASKWNIDPLLRGLAFTLSQRCELPTFSVLLVIGIITEGLGE